MLRPGNVATPPTAATLAVPDSVPPPAFVPIATVTLAVKAVTVLPRASRAVTCTAGVIGLPAVVLVGWTEKTSSVAAPDVTLKAALVLGGTPVALAPSVYPTPLRLMLRFANAALPAVVSPVARAVRV